MTTKVSQHERARRATQAQVAKSGGSSSHPGASEEAQLLTTVTKHGTGLTKGQQAAMEARLAAVNLDEVAEQPFTVAYRDFIEEEVPDEAYAPESGKTRLRRRPIERKAVLDPMVPAALQLDAMSLSQVAGQSEREQLTMMVDLVVKAWTRTEPDMTVEKLLEAMDITRISALFRRFFNPATGQ